MMPMNALEDLTVLQALSDASRSQLSICQADNGNAMVMCPGQGMELQLNEHYLSEGPGRGDCERSG